ncbi:MAG: LTA synthase family protein [Olsenella sp.]|jgi:hypothetical protein|nr:LTA synthase family protein [Olsenella sp.]MCI1289599.1 LTA synthase family protein [Olsenella sp.]
MQGTEKSAVFCPLILGCLVALVLVTLGYAVLDGALLAHASASGEKNGSPVRRALRHVRPSVILWSLPYLGILTFLYIWCARGLYSGATGSLDVPLRATLACAALTLPRLRVVSLVRSHLGERAAFWVGLVANVALMALAVNFARIALEVPWNADWQDIALQFVAIEYVIILLGTLTLFFLFQCRGGAVAVGVLLMLLLGIAQYFVFLFKDANITPADLQAIGTAAEVSGGYVFTITAAVAKALGYAAAGVACAAYLVQLTPVRKAAPEAKPVARHAAHAASADDKSAGTGAGAGNAIQRAFERPATRRTALGLLSMGGLAAFVTIPGYGADFGVSLNHWNSMYSTSRQGFFPCFVKEFQARLIPVPANYNDSDAKSVEKDLVSQYAKRLGTGASSDSGTARKAAVAQFKKKRPTVVVIMNESFSDLSVYKSISAAGYAGPTFVKTSLTDALLRGDSYTSIFGGGTCNSEFEALCGVNLHYLGANKYPYTQWDFTKVPCMPRQFAALGYKTYAIHPNEATNWDRKRVYEQMGFDRFYSITDFAGAQTYHNGYVSDRATYQKILTLLKKGSTPEFIHTVTMQNHGPFTTGTIPTADELDYEPEGASTSDNFMLNEYLSCATESDRAIEWFLGEVKKLDRPVAVLFFGDHQPKPASPYATLGYEDESSIQIAERMYHTTYFMWANYDVAGNSQTSETEDLPVSALGDKLMYHIGAPISRRQEANLASRKSLPILSLIGYQDAKGNWHEFTDADDETIASPSQTKNASAARHMDSMMAYVNYLRFGSIVN